MASLASTWRLPMQIDDICTGPRAGGLANVHPVCGRLRVGSIAETISRKWIQQATTDMWFWLAGNRKELLDGFLAQHPDDSLLLDGQFLAYLKHQASAEGVTVSRLLFGVPDCAEERLCMDDGAFAMTSMWSLRELPEETLLTFDAEAKPLSGFARRAFGPKKLPTEFAYLVWRFGSLPAYVLHTMGVQLPDSSSKTGPMKLDLMMSAAMMGVPVSYSSILASAGLPFTKIVSSWQSGMPAEYAVALEG